VITIKPMECAQIADPDKFANIALCDTPSLPGTGWCLLAVLCGERVERETGDAVVYMPPYDRDGCSYGATLEKEANVQHVYKVMRPLFLMGQLTEPAFEELRNEVSEAKNQVNELMRQLDDTRKNLKNTSEALEKTSKRRDELNEHANKSLALQKHAENECKSVKDKLDILKQEIGAARWREIFGEEVKDA